MIELMLQAERSLMVGMVDQAERLYLMASRNDPRNAIAVVGLARVALERNDDRAAYGLACDALAIDPDNAAALRLEARLSEVLQHRGEPVERPDFVLPGGPGTAAGDDESEVRPKAEAPFPPARKVAGNEADEALGTVMRAERPGWQPAKMPDLARPAAFLPGEPSPARGGRKEPWAPPGWSTQDVPAPASPLPPAPTPTATGVATSPTASDSKRSRAASVMSPPAAAKPTVSVSVSAGAPTADDEPRAIRIRPTSSSSSGPTRYVAVTVPDEPESSPATTLPGGVPASAMGQRPFASSDPADPSVPAAASDPPRRSFLRRLFGR